VVPNCRRSNFCHERCTLFWRSVRIADEYDQRNHPFVWCRLSSLI